MNKLKLLLNIFITFFKISLFTFGGGFAMLPLLKFEAVEKKKWITDDELTDIFTASQLVPGLIYISTATFIGFRVAGAIGAFLATLAVLIPSGAAIMILVIAFSDLFNMPIVQRILQGVIIGISAMLANVSYTMIKKSVRSFLTFIALIISFILLEFFNFKPYIIILLGIFFGITYSLLKSKRGKSENV